jgi:type II restriction enzyme
MQLQMDASLGTAYKSNTQLARCITENWASAYLYCAACRNNAFEASPPNTKAVDLSCLSCGANYQLKSGRKWNQRRIPDAAYNAMIAAIESDRTPNLLVMQYSSMWRVENLMLIPSFFFAKSCVEKRKPLGAQARRAGWVGCNIRLDAIAPEGKLTIVQSGVPAAVDVIRESYEKLRPLSQIPAQVRGWTLDLLRILQTLPTAHFALNDVYAREAELAALHPGNKHVRAKIRQQLQVLRDAGLLTFNGRGIYRLK